MAQFHGNGRFPAPPFDTREPFAFDNFQAPGNAGALLDGGETLSNTGDVDHLGVFHPSVIHNNSLYASHDNETALARSSASNSLDSLSGLWEMDIDSTSHLQEIVLDEMMSQDPFIDEYNFPMIDSFGIEDFMANNDQYGPNIAMPPLNGATMARSYPPFHQNPPECSQGQVSNYYQDDLIGSSNMAACNHQNLQSFEASRGMWAPNCGFTMLQNPKPYFPRNSFATFPNQGMAASFGTPLHSLPSQYYYGAPHYQERSRTWPLENVNRHDWPERIPYTQQYTSEGLFTDPQSSTINPATYGDLPSSNWFGLSLARTASPENTELTYHKTSSSSEDHGRGIWNHAPPLRRTPTKHPVRPRKMFKKGNPSRKLTDQGKEDARDVRLSGGACVDCRHTHKLCCKAASLPCEKCSRIIKNKNYLAPVICYRRNFEQVLSVYSDYFDLEQRGDMIKSAIESMDGKQSDLYLGSGLREYENQISIDINPSSVCHVKVQLTTTLPEQHWISTQSPTASMVAQESSAEKSYAIVPSSLPDIAALDQWGREEIRALALKWPKNLELSYDLALLEYSEATPQLPCYMIVQLTLRIISLGKNLDSRRPIDHDKIVQMVNNLPPSSSQFGIEEFNDHKASFQLSMVARTQFYIHAAKAIDPTQRALGKEIDKLLKQKEGRTEANFLIVGACLRRLSLEYRQRLQRYRCFASEEVEDRVERCLFMYTLFTRLYEVWYRGRPLPMCSEWTVAEFSKYHSDKRNLVEAFSRLQSLEQAFCAERLDTSDDSLYRTLISEPSEKLCKTSKAASI